MNWALFLIFPSTLAAGFWFGVDLWPDLASKELLRAIAGLFAIAWTGCAFALPKLSELTALEGLVQRERDMLAENIGQARRRVWRIAALSLACVLTLIFLSIVTNAQNSHWVAAFAGFSTAVGIAFIWVFRGWHDEIHAFIADVNQHRLDAKAQTDVLRRFANSKGA